jgi:protein CLEC16A
MYSQVPDSLLARAMSQHHFRSSTFTSILPGIGMFGRSAVEPPPAPANAETRFTLVELRKLHKQLVENKRVNDANEGVVVEILRVIAEMVVYGDNKSEMLFDFFCEKNMLSLFLELMRTSGGCPSAVHIQILQTLSILISCVRNDTSLYYLLSNNYINEIIIYPHDFINDESLCAQFASFMKTLSLKLNIHTVQFFFIEETGAFPILTRAVELLTIPDPMIRIASQNTILNVYRVEDSRARAYALQDEVMGIMFAQTVNFMENQYHTIFKTCKNYYKMCNAYEETAAGKLEDKLDDALSAMEDWFFYLQDLLDLDVPVLRKALVHQLVHDFLLPVLLNPLLKNFRLYQEAGKWATVRLVCFVEAYPLLG